MGTTRGAERLGEALNSRAARIGLSLLLAVSMLRVPAVTELWWLFFAVFGVELLIRLRVGPGRERAWRLFVLIDILALISFLPLDVWFGKPFAALMVVLRLMRLAVLLRFAQGLALDVWRILTRREQLAQFGLVTLAVTALAFASAVVLTELAVPHDYDGPPGFASRFWWSFRQVQDAGNLVDQLPVHPIALILSLVLTIIGVFIISFVIGIGTRVVEQVVLLERKRRIEWRGHTLIVGPIANAEVLVREYVNIHAKNRSRLRLHDIWRKLRRRGPLSPLHGRAPIALLGSDDRTPDFLHEPAMRSVVYRPGSPASAEDLDRVGIVGVKRALIIANTAAGADVDAVSVAALTAIRRQNTEAHVFVEVRDPRNVALVRRVGGPHTHALHLPRYVGLFLCHQIVVPGVDQLYAELLTAHGEELYSHVFVDDADAAVLATLQRSGPRTSFRALGEALLVQTGCVLLGVLEADMLPKRGRDGLIDLGDTGIRLNPLADTSLGPQGDMVDGTRICGIVALAPSYLDLRDSVRRAWRDGDHGARAGESDVTAAVAIPARYRHVLIVGYSGALRPLLDALPAFAPGVRITVVISARQGRAELRRRLDELHEELGRGEAPGRSGRCVSLPRGARLTVFTHDESDLATFALGCIEPGDLPDAAVFLSDPDSSDRDARTLLRLIRFQQAFGTRARVPAEDHVALHLVAEFASAEQAELARQHCTADACGVAGERFRLTIVSSEHIRNYFMVHSAFVPGIGTVYDQLLGRDVLDEASGRATPEIVRVELTDADADEAFDWARLWKRLTASGFVPLALEVQGVSGSRTVVMVGSRTRDIPAARAVAVFALGSLHTGSAPGKLVGHPVGQ